MGFSFVYSSWLAWMWWWHGKCQQPGSPPEKKAICCSLERHESGEPNWAECYSILEPSLRAKSMEFQDHVLWLFSLQHRLYRSSRISFFVPCRAGLRQRKLHWNSSTKVAFMCRLNINFNVYCCDMTQIYASTASQTFKAIIMQRKSLGRPRRRQRKSHFLNSIKRFYYRRRWFPMEKEKLLIFNFTAKPISLLERCYVVINRKFPLCPFFRASFSFFISCFMIREKRPARWYRFDTLFGWGSSWDIF